MFKYYNLTYKLKFLDSQLFNLISKQFEHWVLFPNPESFQPINQIPIRYKAGLCLDPHAKPVNKSSHTCNRLLEP